ncbi:MAG: dephospho-CoA kinase [Gemmatimonadota bacterium]
MTVLRVGLTGNLGAGKSAVGELFRRWGARVVDADDVAREVAEPGQPALAALVSEFGSEVLDAGGRLDRDALRRRIAADPEARSRLEAILHPPIVARIAERLADAEARGVEVAVAVVPLLFETEMAAAFDAVVLVDAPEETRLARVVESGKMTDSEARAIAAAQAPAAEKRARADAIVENDADLRALERRARAVWEELRARAREGAGS